MSNDIAVAEDKALTVPEQAKAYPMVTADDYTRADEIMAGWAGLEKEIHEAFDPQCDAAHKAWKTATEQRKKYLDPIEEGRKILKKKAADWRAEQEKKRIEAERLAAIEAKQREEQERELVAAELEDAGDVHGAAAIRTAPIDIIAPKIESFVPKSTTKFREQYSASIVDIFALCRAVSDKQVSWGVMYGIDTNKHGEVTSPALNKMAVALKTSMSIPGVVVVRRTV